MMIQHLSYLNLYRVFCSFPPTMEEDKVAVSVSAPYIGTFHIFDMIQILLSCTLEMFDELLAHKTTN